MSLDKAMKKMILDTRLTEWSLNNGQLTKEELKKHLDALPDLKDKVEVVNLSDERHRNDSDSLN